MRSNTNTAIAVMLCGFALSACASAAGGTNSYSADLDRLEADCTAREGILTPTGSQSGQPARDYACKITGGASRLR
jgi:hypothetical protein